MSAELLFRNECYQIVGACLAVHKDKGNGLQLGILVNFGSHPRLEWERIVLTHL